MAESGSSFLLRAVGKCISMRKNSISTVSKFRIRVARFCLQESVFYIGNNYFYCRVHFGKTDFAGEEAVDSGDYQAGVIADYDSIYVFSH